MGLRGDLLAVGLAGAVLVAAAWYAKKKIAAAAGAVGDAAAAALPYVNPTDERNVVNQAAQGFYQAVTGDTNGTIGTGIYDATHGGFLSNGTFNPTSDNNLLYRANAWTVQKVTGDPNATLGTKIYDWFH